MHIEISEASIEEIIAISKCIPEFEKPYERAEYKQRVVGNHLSIIARCDGILAGFKVGYDRFGNGSFYSFMGGVIPEFRRQHIATALADYQEKWVRTENYESIIFKTRNKHKNMIIFSLKRGFYIIGHEPAEEMTEDRIIMKKELIS